MRSLFWSGLIMIVLISGCGWNGTPTRHNDFTPVTSITISADYPTLAKHTSARLTATGDFSGLFPRDITDQVVWSSDTPSVAAFMSTEFPNRVTGLSPGTATVTATKGTVSATFLLTVSPATVTVLEITPANPSIAKGVNQQFDVNGTFSDATTQKLTSDASWVSSASDVASVNDSPAGKGLVKALAVGSATLTATFDTVSATTLVTVTEPVLQSIALSPDNPSVLTLSTKTITATGTYSDGSTADVTSQVAWSSSDTAVATIAANGTVSARAQGTTTISATLGAVHGTTTLKATGGNLTAIAVFPATVSLVKDTTGRISATGTFSNGSVRDVTEAVTWTSANPAVATVTPAGGTLAWLNPLGVTPATVITATYGVLSSTSTMTVTSKQLSSLAIISPATLNITAGTGSRFTATATYSDGTTQDVTANTDWSSSVVSTATVDNSGTAKGRVSGVAAGSSVITASYGSKTATVTVAVQVRALQNLVISGSSNVAVGNHSVFTAMANYSDGTSVNVTEKAAWTTDSANILTAEDSLNLPGKMVAVSSGSTTLTASFGGKSQPVTVVVP